MGNVTATLHTNKGDIDVELYDDRAPSTVDNFVGLATGGKTWTDPESGDEVDGEALYDDVAFHRVIEDFMIQGGDPTETGRGGPGYQFDDEFHDELRHDDAGILSMANSGPNTNGSQFFITLGPQPTSTTATPFSAKSLTAWMSLRKSVASTPAATTNPKRTSSSSPSRSTTNNASHSRARAVL